MIVHNHLHEAFNQASLQFKDTQDSWLKISYLIYYKYLPGSPIGLFFYSIGKLDILLRSLEHELKIYRQTENHFIFRDYQRMFSDIWVSNTYEILRRVKSSEKLKENDLFIELFHHFTLLRIPIDKFEIAKDRHLEKNPFPVQIESGTGEKFTLYEYDANNPNRCYLLPRKYSPSGSMVWETIDSKTGKSINLERLSLSDRILQFFSMELSP